VWVPADPPSLARAERLALCTLLEEVGPDAPTLCEGWTTADLAAHLVVRERRPDSGPGLVVKPLAGWTERVRTGARGRPYAELIALIRSGPPRWSPFGLPGADRAANTVELFVHHEDVRRARPRWEPRPLSSDVEHELWRRLGRSARMLFRRVPVGLVLRRPEGATITARKGTPTVTMTGRPGELLLYASGRQDHARVELEGDPVAVRGVAEARLGI